MKSVTTFLVDVYDAKGNSVSIIHPPPADTFHDNFCVHVAEGKNRKVLMGFQLKSKTPLSTIKSKLMAYLTEHELYVWLHTSSFAHEVHTAFLGYFRNENLRTANLHDLNNEIKAALTHFWIQSSWNAH
jgi:hypothetical protein